MNENLVEVDILSQNNIINVTMSQNTSLEVSLLGNLVPLEPNEDTDFELIFLTSII